MPPPKDEDVVLWDCDPSAETLTHDTQDAAIESYLDGCRYDQFPTTCTVYGWRRRTLDHRDVDADMILERIIEDLDDEYGGGDEMAEPSDAMKAAAEALAEVTRRDYEVWQCEQVTETEVNVAAWVAEHRPDWLKAGA